MPLHTHIVSLQFDDVQFCRMKIHLMLVSFFCWKKKKNSMCFVFDFDLDVGCRRVLKLITGELFSNVLYSSLCMRCVLDIIHWQAHLANHHGHCSRWPQPFDIVLAIVDKLKRKFMLKIFVLFKILHQFIACIKATTVLDVLYEYMFWKMNVEWDKQKKTHNIDWNGAIASVIGGACVSQIVHNGIEHRKRTHTNERFILTNFHHSS